MKGKSAVWSFYSYRVCIRIEGFRIDRLINKVHQNGIALRELRIISDTEAEGWIARQDLGQLRKLAKSLYRITVTESRGPKFQTLQFVRRPVTAAGAVIAAAIVAAQSLFVAGIEIDGYRAIPEDSLRLCLERSGIYEGVYRPGVDWAQARENLRTTFPQLTWIQLVYDGRIVLLNVAESDNKILSAEAEPGSDIFVPSAEREKVYCDIVADQAGYIEKISTLWGAACVEEGDYVEAGDVLISGTVVMEPTTFKEDWPTEYYVRAQGEVTALVPYRLTFNQERYIKEPASDDGGLVTSRAEKTEKQAEMVVNQQIRLWIKENLPENAEIVNESLNFCYKNNIIETGVTLEVRQQIGIEKEILVGPQNSDN